MYRFALDYLKTWKGKSGRKPLVIRGARQVGKTHLVRDFAQELFESVVEFNFERNPELGSVFACNSPREIVGILELRFNTTITPGKTLLFLDEIQAAPQVIPVLRYFLEEAPELHVVAAGSLLEFALFDFPHSMPVGRIEYLHLGPMQFEEFLLARGEQRLVDYLDSFAPGEIVPGIIHQQLLDAFKCFLIVGGMPEAISSYLRKESFREAEEIKHSILSTFKDDFGKYSGRVPHVRLQKLFGRLPALVGSRFKYVRVDREEPARAIGRALDLFCLARVAHRVRHTSANGVPLGAEAKDNAFKTLFLDVGLMSTALGLTLLDFERAEELLLVNSGAICEQVVGQHLLHSLPFYQEPDLFYWTRQKSTSSAEVDYVIAEGQRIIPVEVKAGKTGRLKSLHSFLREKDLAFGLRLNSDLPSLLEARTVLADGRNVPFRLLSLPLYMVGQIRRLVRMSSQP